jgi:hypothetical protein
MKRRSQSFKKGKRHFSRTAGKVHPRNNISGLARGGIRL